MHVNFGFSISPRIYADIRNVLPIRCVVQEEARQATLCAKIFEKTCWDILAHMRQCSLDQLPVDAIGQQLLNIRRPQDGKQVSLK